MALQGSLDDFALPDVLRLLASTRKTGRLQLVTERGRGTVWVDGGSVVGVSAELATTTLGTADVLFELLRSNDGVFEFEPRALAPHGGEAEDVEPLLAEAEARLVEWREIEAVVPSLAAWVSLRPTLPSRALTIDSDQWSVVVAIGGGVTAGHLGALLGLGEIPVSRCIKAMVETGIVTVGAPDVISAAPLASPVAMDDMFLPSPEPVDDELASQLAMLSPRAAHAVAAASLDTATG